MSIVKFDPTTLVQIKVGDLSAPVSVGIELSKIYLTTDQVIRELILDIERNEDTGKLEIPYDLLPWIKEQRFLLSEIHKMTGEVENKVGLEKLRLAADVFKEYFKDLPQAERIKIIRKLKKDAKQPV